MEGSVSIVAEISGVVSKFKEKLQNDTASTTKPRAIASGGVVNAASFEAPISPGTLFSIFGSGLATGTKEGFALPFPTNWNGTSVRLNGVECPLVYVSPTQINAQVPSTISPGRGMVQVLQNGVVFSEPIDIVAASPGIFVRNGERQAIVQALDGGLRGPDNPAAPGDIVTLYGTGIGSISPALATGEIASPNLSRATLPFSATIDGLPAEVQFLGLAPGFLALMQINMRIPYGIRAGNDIPFVLTINGVSSRPTYLSVRSAVLRTVEIRFTNKLLNPVQILANDQPITTVGASQTSANTVAVSLPLRISFLVEKSKTSGGTLLGDGMAGYYNPIHDPTDTIAFSLGAKIGDSYFFKPRIKNTGSTPISIMINGGLQSENRCNCSLSPSPMATYDIGYYLLYSNSNVRAYQSGTNYTGSYSYFDGFGERWTESGAIDFSFGLESGSGGGNSPGFQYTGTNAAWVVRLLQRVGWTGGDSPRISGDCIRDQYVAAAVAYAWAAESYARANNSTNATNMANNMMGELRKAQMLCSDSTPVIPGAGTCSTLNIFQCGEL